MVIVVAKAVVGAVPVVLAVMAVTVIVEVVFVVVMVVVVMVAGAVVVPPPFYRNYFSSFSKIQYSDLHNGHDTLTLKGNNSKTIHLEVDGEGQWSWLNCLQVVAVSVVAKAHLVAIVPSMENRCTSIIWPAVPIAPSIIYLCFQ